MHQLEKAGAKLMKLVNWFELVFLLCFKSGSETN